MLDNVFNEAPAFTSNDPNSCCFHHVNKQSFEKFVLIFKLIKFILISII